LTLPVELTLLALSVVGVALLLFWLKSRIVAPDDEEDTPGMRRTLRAGLVFVLGPFPLSIALHVLVLLFLIFAVHMQQGEGLIPISLAGGGGGGGPHPQTENTDLPDTPMPEMAAIPVERPVQVGTVQREAVSMANNYVRSVSSGIGTGRGGGMGAGYGEGVGQGFGGFIGGLRKTGLDVVIVIDGTGSMKRVIDDVKAKMRQLTFAIHRLVPIARIGIVVFGGRGEPIQVQPLTLSNEQLTAFLDRIVAHNGGEWQENTLGAVQMAVNNMGWRSYAKKVIVLVGDTPPFKEDYQPTMDLIRQFRGENGTFNTVDLTVEEHERFVKEWYGFVPANTDTTLPEFYMETQTAYKAMAEQGGGVWRSLTKDQQINQQVLILAFGQEWQNNVAAFGRGMTRSDQ